MLALVTRLARVMAMTGGIVLTALVLLTCLSVLGRGLNSLGHSEFLTGLAPGLGAALIGSGVGPVTGDYEIVEAGIAFAVFAFLPICQLNAAHATVDVFTNLMPRRLNAWLLAFWEMVLSAVILIIAWKLFDGMMSMLERGQTTFLLQFPVWWAYLAAFVAAVVAGVVAVYCAIARLLETLSGRSLLPGSEGAPH